jgi:uncharacterized membrane protein
MRERFTAATRALKQGLGTGRLYGQAQHTAGVISSGLHRITWFPFIGWYIVLMARRDGDDRSGQVKQAFIAAVLFTAIPVTLYFILQLVSYDWREIRFALVLLIYCSHLLYFVLCGVGTMMMRRGSEFQAPVIGPLAARLQL